MQEKIIAELTEEDVEKSRLKLTSGDACTSVADLKDAVCKFRDIRDWKQFHNPKDLAVAMAVEAAEVLELCRFKNNEDIISEIESGKRDFADEMADVLSYILSLADVLNIDLSKALAEKMVLNAQHYPVALAKGRKAKYTDLKQD